MIRHPMQDYYDEIYKRERAAARAAMIVFVIGIVAKIASFAGLLFLIWRKVFR